jgi:hypothetical protein
MSPKLAAFLVASATAYATPALAQAVGSGANVASTEATGSTSSEQPAGRSQQGTSGSSQGTEIHNAQTGANTKIGFVSAPGVGVGHAANGKPIGTKGSGLGSPERPIDGRHLPRQ